ncbi:F-actin-capping protein subunit beta [Cyberlindnera jadinii]|uniref:F-actin-capping protein subunit beta n=1 Tax=Cyberlindnera jadinii (strain ATCC 18201 / CBS 1600 / BCRC 20928 / JCM 3617 / NBRC 0987 / NRRL Y-1542) TaxID=983966 RepID=A0A0H5C7E0_CYBJN|nr:F-actin-capping protein subunit beta [Cyberlindnera jadinii]
MVSVLPIGLVDSYDAALDLLRRLNPQNITENLEKIIHLNPDLAEDLLSTVDVPLSIAKDPTNGKPFLTCDYNRDLDSFRSPWSNKYYPQLDDDDSPYPSAALRELEVKLNDAVDIYRDLYYEGGISSVYLWDQDDSVESGFAGVALFKKSTEDNQGLWDSIHVLEVEKKSSTKYLYKATSTIILDLTKVSKENRVKLSGNLIRQNEKIGEVEKGDLYGHIVNIGSLVEDVESKLRNLLQQVYFDKTSDIIGDLRTLGSLSQLKQEKEQHSEVIKGMQGL